MKKIIIGFSAIVIIGGIVVLYKAKQTVVNDAPPLPEHTEILTDLTTIKATMSSLVTRVLVTEVPNQKSLEPYQALPYFFAKPDRLLVRDKIKFMHDLGYTVGKNILSLSYGKDLVGKSPDFIVLPKEMFMEKYRELQIARFNAQKASLQQKYDSNKKIIEGARLSLPSDSPQLIQLEQQADTAQKQLSQFIAEQNQIISDLSDPSSLRYRQTELITGGFVPPHTILFREPQHSEKNLALDNIGELVRQITHEMLHYYGNAESEKYLTPFFYEGFTEYLTLKALGYNEKMYLHSGYPMHTQVMETLAKRIPLPEIERIHFTQDGNLFEVTIRKYFPSVNFESFTDATNKINEFWFTHTAKDNADYKNDPMAADALKYLGI